MTYVDTSVALAELFAEDRRPPVSFWEGPLCSSRLLEYELWTRVHARGAARTHGDAARELLSRVAMVELAPTVLARALEPFPIPLRTLDALHLSTAVFLAEQRQPVAIAAYDERMRAGAEALGLRLARI
ncbi:MAG TPA: PIN domain-containing protein [Anaeromyxobacteraceae bacterium]|nr:PIN domain-containing protein [Anaeromyxobacteraceae bacterium]